ncbi:MAG: peptidoglycan-binding protein [Candidatus Pacebacteria bacterium]|nr:peptidoglycan-binding protein [Candidatus Paceibacterota bacterium]MBP9867109.1 peptidoglycan-binding protein [Candidatus Paceibacterota bacterium]
MIKNQLISVLFLLIVLGQIDSVSAVTVVSNITSSQAEIIWNNQISTTTGGLYGNPLYFSENATFSPNESTVNSSTESCPTSSYAVGTVSGNITNSCIKIKNLKPNTTYYFKDPEDTTQIKHFKTLDNLLVPTQLFATFNQATAVNSAYITLTWVDSSTSATHFKITRSLPGATPITFTAQQSDLATKTFKDTQLLVSGTSYSYRVQSCDANHCSDPSDPKYVSVPVTVITPSTPTNFVAEGTSTITLKWTDTSTNETLFEIWRGTTTPSMRLFREVSSNSSSSVDTSPYYGYTNMYSVRACTRNDASANSCSASTYTTIQVPEVIITTTNENNIPSAAVNNVTASSSLNATTTTGTTTITLSRTPLSVPDKPTVPKMNIVSSSSVIFTWKDVSNESKYILKKRTANGSFSSKSLPQDTTTYTDNVISTGITTYTIEACTSNNICSPALSLGAFTLPSMPIGFNIDVAPSASSIKLAWKDSQNENFYVLKKSKGGLIFNLVKQISKNATTYTDTGLDFSTYKYSLEACVSEKVCSYPVFSSFITLEKPNTTIVATTTPKATTTLAVSIATSTVSTSFITFNETPAVVIKEDIVLKPNKPTSLESKRVRINGELTDIVSITWKDTSDNETSFRIVKNGNLLKMLSSNSTSYQDDSKATGYMSYSIESCNTAGCTASDIVYLAIPTPNYEVAKALGNFLRKGDFIQVKSLNVSGAISSTYSATVLDNGLFSMDIPDGTYIVEGITPNKIITVVNKKVTSVTDKTTKKNIIGYVVHEDGKPVFDAEVVAYKASTNERIATSTDIFGKYILQVNQGVWHVIARPKNTETNAWEMLKEIEDVTLSDKNTDETINASKIVVSSFNANLVVKIVDEENKSLHQVGVIIDTHSLSDTYKKSVGNLENRNIIVEKTNENGLVTFPIRKGTYYIRTSVQNTLKYLESKEEVVTLTGNENKNIIITLKKEQVLEKIVLSGNVIFDDKAPVINAFVSAWSDQGDHVDTLTNIDGNYSLSLLPNQVWHIKAAKDEGKESYISDEQTIHSSKTKQNLNITFFKSQVKQLAPVVHVVESAHNEVRVIADDGARFTVQPNSVQVQNTINVEIKPTVEALSQSASTVVSTAYDITIKDSSNGQKITKLQEEAEILIPYDEEELRSKGITLESVIPSYYDESISSWVPVTKFIINKEKKVFVLQVDHLTRFALIAAADTIAPLPPSNVVTDAQTPTDVRITWQKPSTDYRHAKIYRSEKVGVLGDILAVEVLSNSFVDKTKSAVKKVYYYTVRSVDPAGNESTNLSQIAYTVDAVADGLATNNSETPSLLLPPGQITEGKITRLLSVGSKGDDVTALQKALKLDGFYATGPITGYYGKLTENAVFRFQNYYKAELLIPNGYKIGTGVLGPITRKKINEIIESSLTE